MASMTASDSTTLPQEFSNRTLVGNWYEDRYGRQASPRTTPIRDFNTTERVVCRDLPEGENDFLTTKQATDASRMTAPPPINVKKPSLYSAANLTDRLAAYSTPPQLAYTLGRTSPEELASVPKPDMDTTYKHFFQDKRDEALASTGEAAYFSLDNTHRRQSPVTKPARELTESMHAPAAPGGAKGARGEVTRRPAESGNVYGVSVYVDEYARWGTKLAGMKLGETVARKQTQYF